MSDVLLIYPYRYTGALHAHPYHPLGIAQLAAILRREGIDASVLDCTFLEPRRVTEEILARRPRLVGIYAMVTMKDRALAVAEEAGRLLPGTPVVCGGPLPTLQPAAFLRSSHAVLRGEAVLSLPALCRDFLGGKVRLEGRGLAVPEGSHYPGLVSVTPEGPVSTPRESTTAALLDGLPLPDRSGFDHLSYQRFWEARDGSSPALLMTSYGCPHDCEFCSRPVFGRRFRRRSTERVVEEIHELLGLGYDELRISDDSFLLDPSHARSLCLRIIEERIDVSWTCLARVDQASDDEARLMKRAGCRKVYFGLESGDDSVLGLMGKNFTVRKAEEAVRTFARRGIATAGYFMVGYPGETEATVEKTFAWALSLPLDEISFTIPYPLPDTRLFRRVAEVDGEADWSFENENSFVFSSPFDEVRLRRRIAETVARFQEKAPAHRR